MPVVGPQMSPRHFVQLLALEVAVGDAEAMVAAEFQQSLTVLIQLAHTEVAETGGPCLPVGSYACVKVAQLLPLCNDYTCLITHIKK